MTPADQTEYETCPVCGTRHHLDDETACEAALAMQEPDLRPLPDEDDQYPEEAVR